MDHYKILGLSRNATKDEIKEAFRRLALKFHPDKHLQSSKEVRDGATLRFKQVSEAYEVLIDDQKRAYYNKRCGSSYGGSGFSSSGYGYRRNDYRQRSRPRAGYGNSRWNVSDLDIVFSILLGGAVAIERSGDALWRMHNSGKSFEEAMESLEKNKTPKKN
ncbi:chaperone protein dnaJ 72 [Cinnamomum micranthum f. kanehirae]|uniref:Chaperone protein dnaJ 72 n=1 Tax=Cinnamomum micranthum f. kanehirae TaxID=337451 RepID=A0A443NBJ0_9MAGN|nr:chaperone protein dnaJ 72 [Cinnamomum micranthum f. kanehirae]